MNAALHNRAVVFLNNLDHLSATGQHDAFINEVLESHGRFDAPNGDRSHLWELELHGIAAEGTTDEEAIANWKRLARKSFPTEEIEDDAFITIHPPKHQLVGGVA